MSYNDLDILSGRGGKINHHSGNRVFLRFVQYKKELYKNLSKKDKDLLVRSILQAIEKEGMRFLKPDETEKGKWCELDKKEAFKKTKQALREPDPPGNSSKRPCLDKNSKASSNKPGPPVSTIGRTTSVTDVKPPSSSRLPSIDLKPPAVDSRLPSIEISSSNLFVDDCDQLLFDFRASSFFRETTETLVTPLGDVQVAQFTNAANTLALYSVSIGGGDVPGLESNNRQSQASQELLRVLKSLSAGKAVVAGSASQDFFLDPNFDIVGHTDQGTSTPPSSLLEQDPSVPRGGGPSIGPAVSKIVQEPLAKQKSVDVSDVANFMNSLDTRKKILAPSQVNQDCFSFTRSGSIGSRKGIDGQQQQDKSKAPLRQRDPKSLPVMTTGEFMSGLDFLLQSETSDPLSSDGNGPGSLDQLQDDQRGIPFRQADQESSPVMTTGDFTRGLDFLRSETSDPSNAGKGPDSLDQQQQDKRGAPSRQADQESLPVMANDASMRGMEFLRSETSDQMGGGRGTSSLPQQQSRSRVPIRQASQDLYRYMRSVSKGEVDIFNLEKTVSLSFEKWADGLDRQQPAKRRVPSRQASQELSRWIQSVSLGAVDAFRSESQDFVLLLSESLFAGDTLDPEEDLSLLSSERDPSMQVTSGVSVSPAANNEPLRRQPTLDIYQLPLPPLSESMFSTL